MTDDFLKGQVDGLLTASFMAATLVHELEQVREKITMSDAIERVRILEEKLAAKSQEIEANLRY